MELKALDRAIGAPTRKTPLAHNQSVCVFIDDTGKAWILAEAKMVPGDEVSF